MDQHIQFCTRADGVRLAYAVVGEGPPIVYNRPLFGHLELEWDRPEIRAYYETLAREHTLVRWDTHGTGLSDRQRDVFTLESTMADIVAVTAHVGLDAFDLIGDASGGPAAIAFSAKHAERVKRLVLYGTFAYGPRIGSPEVLQAMLSLIRANWRIGSKTFADMIVPDVDAESAYWAANHLQAAVNPDVAARLYEFAWTVDVRELLQRIRAPTLVVHREGDKTAPFALGQELASQIPAAQFVPLQGRSNLPYIGDVDSVLAAVLPFLEDT